MVIYNFNNLSQWTVCKAKNLQEAKTKFLESTGTDYVEIIDIFLHDEDKLVSKEDIRAKVAALV